MSKESPSTNNPNIIVFGQTGSGKSSLINMLAGKDVAKVSSDPDGCTVTAERYDIQKENKTYTFWDTCGLNEGENGSVPAQMAVNNLDDLINVISISLIVYCVRGSRFTDIVRVNYNSFCRSICEGKVPIVLVVTGLEQEEDMDEWWTKHEKDVKRLKITFKAHACVTTIKGRNNTYEKEYQESTDKVWGLVKAHCHSAWRPRRPSHNIIIFGESGSGKSSIVNMIVGEDVAKVSNGLHGCTFKHECYETVIGSTHFRIYDTVGLNEGEQGRVPHLKAVHELYTLVRSLDGVSLLIYCMRGRIKENARENWILFHKVLCAERVPTIAVETGLEYEEDLDAKRDESMKKLQKYGILPMDIARIVSFRGRNKEHEDQYNSSQNRLRKLVVESYRKEPWSTTTDDWIGHIYKTTYTTKLCLFSNVRVEFAKEVRNVVDEFIEGVGMKQEEADQLKSTLLDAETKLRKRPLYSIR